MMMAVVAEVAVVIYPATWGEGEVTLFKRFSFVIYYF